MMIKNYLNSAYRNLKKGIVFSSVNIIGLAIGLAFVILACRYIYTEETFDNFHANYNSIYRIEKTNSLNGISCFCPSILRDWLKNNIPEIKKAARVINDGGYGRNRSLLYKNFKYNIAQPLIVDLDFFSIFSFKIKSGEIQSFKSDIHSIVLRESFAKKIFGDKDPIGKLVTYKNTVFTVKAIIEEPPSNSSIRFDVLLPFENKPEFVTDNWRNNTLQIFVQTAKNISYSELESKLTTEINSVFKSLGYLQNNEAYQNKYILNPLKEIYYSGTPHDNVCIHGNRNLTLLLSSVAFIVLIIAVINFFNITYVKASERIKELGIRSASGASLLNNTFLLAYDSVIPCFLSTLLAIAFVHETEPLINPLLNTPLVEISSLQQLIIIMGILVLAFIAGIYPAFRLASVNIIESIKGKNRPAGKRSFFKGSLSVVQFTASIVLIISLFVIHKQIDFVIRESNSNLGQDVVVYLPLSNRMPEKSSEIFAIQNSLRSLAEVNSVSTSLHLPGDESYSNLGVMLKNGGKDEREILVNHNMVDAGYPETIGCKIEEGRTFNSAIKSDYGSYIVNESFIKKYNISNPEDVTLNGAPLIGVVKDFHYNSLRSKIEPLAIEYSNSYQSRIVVRLAGYKRMSLSNIVQKIRKTVYAIDNTAVSNVRFLDNHIAALYSSEVRISMILFWLSLFSIIISCMGLFSMSLFTVEARNKEIGIRKVVGAKVSDILIMITKDFTKWIIAANLIAYPIAYFTMSEWLENFAYRIELSLWMFILSGGIALVIALATVSFQAIKAAMANPVESLRYE